MTEEWIDLAIENWARWGRVRRSTVRCQSIEHRYRSPQRTHWPNDAPPYEIRVVSIPSAITVEDAWKTLPFRPKMVLKWWYVLRLPVSQICRQFRRKGHPVEVRYWEEELKRAKYLLAQALEPVYPYSIAFGVASAPSGGPNSLIRAA